jgi:hypothetical protein
MRPAEAGCLFCRGLPRRHLSPEEVCVGLELLHEQVMGSGLQLQAKVDI